MNTWDTWQNFQKDPEMFSFNSSPSIFWVCQQFSVEAIWRYKVSQNQTSGGMPHKHLILWPYFVQTLKTPGTSRDLSFGWWNNTTSSVGCGSHLVLAMCISVPKPTTSTCTWANKTWHSGTASTIVFGSSYDWRSAQRDWVFKSKSLEK